MSNIEEIVHIVPLGHEIDRAVKPFDKFKANRVYLLAVIENMKYTTMMLDKQKYFLDVVHAKLEQKDMKVYCKNVDMFDILEVMKVISGIILEEKQRKSIIYLNMSACGRLTSIGATLAAMAHNARVYYVVADRYSETEKEERIHGLSICDNIRVIFLENFRLQLPDQAGVKTLVRLCEEEKGMKTKEIMDFLRKNGVEGFEKDYETMIGEEKRQTQQRYLIRLNKQILEKLERSGYIKREKLGRYNTIRITGSGRYVAHISGLMGHSDNINAS